MSGTFCLSLKAHQRLFINGAVLRFDRKVGVELLNDAVFLLENHVLQPDEITTPLRQLYFVAQTMLMDPSCQPKAQRVFVEHLAKLQEIYRTPALSSGLSELANQFDSGKIVETLKSIRKLFPLESQVLAASPIVVSAQSVTPVKEVVSA